MSNVRNNKYHLPLNLTFNIISFYFTLFIIIIQIKKVFLEYFDSFEEHMLNEAASLIDISDYYNIFPIITTDKKIFAGVPPILKSSTSAKIMSISSAVTYDDKFILMACTEDYLLTKININTGEEMPLVPYGGFNIPNCTCSISTKDNYAYIGVSHIIIPTYYMKYNDTGEDSTINQIEVDYTKLNSFYNLTDINNEDKYYIYYDYNNKYLQNTVIKIKLKTAEENNGPILDDSFNIMNYSLPFKHKDLNKIPFPRPFSCETINIGNSVESRLVCGIVKINEGGEFSVIATVMNSEFNKIENETKIYSIKTQPYIRLQRIDFNSILYIFYLYSYQITLEIEGSKCIIISSRSSNSFSSFKSSQGLFFYNNQYLFSASSSTMYIKKNTTNNYIKVSDSKSIQNVIGYHKEDGDLLIFIYEYTPNEINYFTIKNMSPIYEFETKIKIIEVKSNTSTHFNVSELVDSPIGHKLLSYNSLSYFISTTNHSSSYDKYSFDKNSQILTIGPSFNDWVTFSFYYDGQTNGIQTGFFLENSKVALRTCLFKCGSCSNKYDECDSGTCKLNFTLFEDNIGEGCYPNDQNFPNYIYNKTNDYFQKCFPTCKFCYLINDLSSNINQNCKVCQDGYLRSYIFPGNCYKYEYPQNLSNYSKIVENIGDENFTIVDSCLERGKLKIKDTGECVDLCPKDLVYYTYYLNGTLNFSNQAEDSIGILYPLKEENIPKYYFNKVCYSTCPQLTYGDNNLNKCRCSYGWHFNYSNNETICYDHKDYCLSLEYYYHTDDKECVLSGCKEGYYQINFECYKNQCPSNAIDIYTSVKKCESKLKYCYIDEHYRTHCSNSPYEGYNLKYNDTKTYFRYCNESIFYFNVKTYLYKNICYEFCPEETILNATNDRCSCLYYIYYVNKERSDYECLKETEKCWDKKRYNLTDRNECVNTQQECVDLGYMAFNDECSHECPKNTELKENEENENEGGICLCKYYYYNDSNYLTCFDNGETCENKNYPIKMESTNECFLNKYECTKRSFKFYNNICYENSCPTSPVNTIEKYNNGICICYSYYFNNSDILECFEEGITCKNHEPSYPYTNIDTKECFNSLEDCINRDLKIFNKDCYSKCPENTKEKKGDFACICSGYFHREKNEILNCFNPNETCESKGFLYTYVETKECFYTKEECIDKGYKIFNNKCYDKCPEDTEDTFNDKICIDKYPDLFYTDRKSCPYIYKKNCVLECPSGACLNMHKKELVECIEYTENMKIYNSICIEGIKPYVESLKFIENDDDIMPIITTSGVVLNAFSIDAAQEELINKNPNMTFVELGECKEQLRESYNLPPDVKIYIVGIDTPNLYGNSSINVFNYEIYLKNGTQLESIQACEDIKIILSSNINDLESIKFLKAVDFYEDHGYDIYNRTDIFYLDPCSSAEDEGNNIALFDRSKYYYPNISICNEGCIYNDIDYQKKRFICYCNANLSEKVYHHYNDQEFIEEEDDESYLEYFLSFINYDIFACINLFFKFNNYYSNAGFYISFTTLIVCFFLLFIFWVKGIKEVRLIMYRNIPTREKLLQIIKKQEEREKKSNRDKIIDCTIHNISEDKSVISPPISNNNLLNNIVLDNNKVDPSIRKGTYVNRNILFNDRNSEEEQEIYNFSRKKRTKTIIVKKKIKKIIRIKKSVLRERRAQKALTAKHYLFDYYSKYIDDKSVAKNEANDKQSNIDIYSLNNKNNNINNITKEQNKLNNKEKNSDIYNKKNGEIISVEQTKVNDKESNIIINDKNKINKEKNNRLPNSTNITNINNVNKNNKNSFKENDHSIKLKSSFYEGNDSKDLMNSIKFNRTSHRDKTINLGRNKLNFELIKKDEQAEKGSANFVYGLKKKKEEIELKIDFNFTHLVDRNDDEIEKSELNSVPYRQALRIDKRSIWQIFISVFTNEVDFLSLFFYRNPYSHYSLYVSIYLFELLLDLMMNCFLYTDDVVSEKYHNNGQLSMITSLSLSIMSNIISSILVYFIAKLTNYCDIIEEIIKNVKYKRKYFENILRLFKYIKVRIGIYFFLQMSFILLMTYYLFIFCSVYDKSQGSVFINYIIGSLISLAISTGLTIIITFLRAISIKYRSVVIFNISKYLYEHF